jgi:cytochrome c oxidase subunit 3
LYFQGNEYYWGEFTITDSVFGSIFYSTTGLHGLHVLIGVIFLIISFIRLFRDSVTAHHNLNYEFAIMYWHLVDIIWIYVFLLYYYSNGGGAILKSNTCIID